MRIKWKMKMNVLMKRTDDEENGDGEIKIKSLMLKMNIPNQLNIYLYVTVLKTYGS